MKSVQNRFSKHGVSMALAAAFALPLAAGAQTTAPAPTEKPAVAPATAPAGTAARMTAAEREARNKAWATDKDALEKALGTGHDKAWYRTSLEKLGYAITSVNKDTADYLEYEIVKSGHSYEVQVNFKDGKSTKVDVTTNVWKDEATKKALADQNYKYTYPTAVTKDYDRVSDRVRGERWAGEKDALEKQLGVGHDQAYYRNALEKAGYKVSSVNEADKNRVEYEVVKGDTSYEVQVDFKDGKSTKVDVTTNMWETESTERVKGERK